ncbi:MAG: hypothetical protein WBW84_20345 [Acidobacteriaceae bacterium]
MSPISIIALWAREKGMAACQVRFDYQDHERRGHGAAHLRRALAAARKAKILNVRQSREALVQIDPSVLNRLIAARHLLESSGPELTPSSDPLVVAQKVLVIHDATELVLLAIVSQLRLQVPEKDGKVKADHSFVALARAVVDHTNDASITSSMRLLEDLNRVRVNFKHHGIVADASTHYHLAADSVGLVDSLCGKLLQQSLLTVDHIAAITLDEVRDHFATARQYIEQRDYKGALESTARGLTVAFWRLETPSSLTAGVPSSEEALLLSGRGVDPASFLVMQQLLPTAHLTQEEPEWQLRKFGHPENWSYENANFCLETATATVVRPQSGRIKPRPFDFYDVFEDVIEIAVDDPEVYAAERYLWSGLQGASAPVTAFRRGDRIVGRATGRWSRDEEDPFNSELDFQFAEWILVLSAVTDKLKLPDDSFGRSLDIWLRKEQVAISYQESSFHKAMREAGSPDQSG